jgi:hypothetical protein
MKISRFVVPALLGLMCLSSARASRADSIGINFSDNYPENDLAATTSAGVVRQANWNNIGGYSSTTGALNNNNGTATTTTLSYSAVSTGEFYYAPATGDEQLNNGYILRLGTTPITFTLNSIPYSNYEIYVYNIARTGTQQKTTLGSTSYYSTSPNPTSSGYVDENAATPFTYTQATSTNSAAPTAGADYVRFTGLSGASQSFSVASLNNNSDNNYNGSVSAIQIVATPEPSTYALMALGLVALCVLGAKRKKDEQAI